jgi:hypothetical protein
MALMRRPRKKPQPHRQRVQDVVLPLHITARSSYVPTVDPSRLKKKVLQQLWNRDEAYLATLSKNSTLIFDINRSALVGVAQAIQFDNTTTVVTDITVLDQTTIFSSYPAEKSVALLIPNTYAYAQVLGSLERYPGTLDCCTGNCARCPRSVICLPGYTALANCFLVTGCRNFTPPSHYHQVGDGIDSWNIYPYVDQQIALHELSGFLRTVYCEEGLDVFLCKHYSIELRRVSHGKSVSQSTKGRDCTV